MWRDFHIGSLSSRHDLYVAIVLGNLSDFDVRTGKVCHDGAPMPVFTK